MSDDNKSPAFRFYARDFLTSEKQSDMSLQEAGAYIRLMCHCWLNGSLPDDMKGLAKRAQATEAQMKKFWPAISKCFELREERWYHPRLEAERTRQATYRERQALHGKKGGRPKNQNETQPFSNIEPEPTKSPVSKNPLANAHANASAIVFSGEGGMGETPPMDLWFQALTSIYPPNRVQRNVRTEQAFVQQMLGFPGGPHAAWQLLQANLDANIHSHEWRIKGMVPGLYRYLDEGLWQNTLPADPPVAEQLSPRTMRMLS